MPAYLAQVSYTSDAWRTQVGNPRSPLDRVRSVAESLGGTFDVAYVTATKLQMRPTIADSEWLLMRADALADSTPLSGRLAAALDEELAGLMFVYADRRSATAKLNIRRSILGRTA